MYLPIKQHTIPKDRCTNIPNDLLNNEHNSSESDGSMMNNSSKDDTSDSDLDISSMNNQSHIPSVLMAGWSPKSRQYITPKHSTQSNKSSKSKSTHYFHWKEKYLITFKWLRYDHLSGVAHCSHSGCNMYHHHLN